MKTSGWYRPALLGAMAIVLLNTWLAASALQTLLNSESRLAHSYEVLDNTRRLVANVRAAESAARGYILTAAPTFEQQFNNVSRGVDDSVNQVRTLTEDNPEQQQRIVVLQQRIAAKMEVLRDGIAVRRGHPTGTIDPSLLGAVVQDTPDKVEKRTGQHPRHPGGGAANPRAALRPRGFGAAAGQGHLGLRLFAGLPSAGRGL